MIHKRQTNEILFIEEMPKRAVQYGASPTFEAAGRKLLEATGVAKEQIVVIPGNVQTKWERQRILDRWLAEHPKKRVTLLCARTRSRIERYILNAVAPADRAGRVTVVGLPEGRLDESAWWRSRDGWKTLFFAYQSLGFEWWNGEEAMEKNVWDPDEYEKTLRQP